MILKWVFDRGMALVGLLFLWPILVVVAVLVKIKMPGGPILFVQKRVGQHGRLFTMHKFRSMTVTHNGSSVSIAGEDRITPFGAVLRKFKLDELPELWDVLVGNMSFVGPRPDVPGYADLLSGDSRRILELRPGITGPASLKYRDEEDLLATIDKALKIEGKIQLCDGRIVETMQDYNDMQIFPDKVRINLYYLNHYSFIKDIQMIFCTILGRRMKYNNEII